MSRTTFDRCYWCIVAIAGITPTVVLAQREPWGVAIAACGVAVLMWFVPKLTRRVE